MRTRLGVRQLRKELTDYLNSDEAVIIGNRRHLRAILVGVPPHNDWSRGEKRKALAAAKRAFAEAIREESGK